MSRGAGPPVAHVEGEPEERAALLPRVAVATRELDAEAAQRVARREVVARPPRISPKRTKAPPDSGAMPWRSERSTMRVTTNDEEARAPRCTTSAR